MSVAAAGAAFLTGFLGSAHCLGMCAGISGLFALHAGRAAASRSLPYAAVYNLGRMLSYATLGAVAGYAGSQAIEFTPLVAGPLRILAGIVIVLIGLEIAFELRVLAPLERSGAVLWERISPLARGLLPVTSLRRALGLGLAWGLLPCGLVYSVLLVAATAGSAADGAVTMFAFGLGTSPAMLATGIGAARLSAFTRQRRNRRLFGLLIAFLGILTLWLPMTSLLPGGSASHH